MPRRMSEDQGAYRAVITMTWEPSETDPQGRTDTTILGPYATRAPARAAVTRAENKAADRYRWGRGGNCTVDGHVEQATAWEKVSA